MAPLIIARLLMFSRLARVWGISQELGVRNVTAPKSYFLSQNKKCGYIVVNIKYTMKPIIREGGLQPHLLRHFHLTSLSKYQCETDQANRNSRLKYTLSATQHCRRNIRQRWRVYFKYKAMRYFDTSCRHVTKVTRYDVQT